MNIDTKVLHQRSKERAYYMYINGDIDESDVGRDDISTDDKVDITDEERYLKALEIEKEIMEDELRLNYEKNLDTKLLTETQIKALKLINQKCNANHSNMIERIEYVNKWDNTKYSHKQLKRDFLEFPLYINFSVKYLSSIAKDTHYRNQFETGHSSGTYGSDRSYWENLIFDRIYDEATPFERPKYGNIPVNKPDGKSKHIYNRLANHYGTVYFVLKDEVKHRTTFCKGDSCECDSPYYISNFNYPSDSICKDNYVIRSFRDEGYSYMSYEYYEIQIHGPIRLNKDIESFHYPAGEDFETKYNVELELLKEKGIKIHSYEKERR